MNARIEWIDEPPQMLGQFPVGLGTISWKNKVPDESLKTFQAAINRVLSKCGYHQIAVDGKLGPNTCGAYAILGDLKNRGCVTDADWASISTDVGAQVTVNCQSFTYPMRLGESKPDQPTSTLTPEEMALPWGRPDPRTTKVQQDLNNDLDGHDYFPIQVTGVLNAETCGAMRLASEEWGMDYMNAFGLNCESFVTPKKRPTPTTAPPTCDPGQKFDPAQGKCVDIECPEGQVFDPVANECTAPPPVTSTKRGAKKSGWGLALLGAAAVALGYFAIA